MKLPARLYACCVPSITFLPLKYTPSAFFSQTEESNFEKSSFARQEAASVYSE